ncbi:hypothetical protein FXN61_11915 [Lentzea sp. PSKA42]|uniref:Uncharacterized protein n=1 Tax=Lentzea indica TaxID=2604800 RepID=A0ABX1FFU1_9PSEU|nr:hypothetical protein [Lentzea indica]NKE57502.1 hypothetical protein [Lentzea indica]
MPSAWFLIDATDQLEISMRWYLATTADHDTHLATPAVGNNVEALCDKTFQPHFELPGEPLDPLQVCAACLAKRALAASGSVARRR